MELPKTFNPEPIEKNLENYLFEDVSYKENSPVKIIEASQKLNVAKHLADLGRKVIILDEKEVIDQVRSIFGNVFEYSYK